MLMHNIRHCFEELDSPRKQYLVHAGIEPMHLGTLATLDLHDQRSLQKSYT